MEIKDILLYSSLFIQLCTLIGIVITVYKFSRDPDIKLNEEVEVIKKTCELKHAFIDENILLIKENHLKHIENDINELKKGQVRIETILSERFKN